MTEKQILQKYAHREVIDAKEHLQTLVDHLFNVSEIASQLGAKIGLKHTSILVALLHDGGKFSSEFQRRLFGEDDKKVNHSSAGARFADAFTSKQWKELKDDDIPNGTGRLFNEIITYVVTSHHGYYDIITLSEEGVQNQRNRRTKEGITEIVYEEQVLPFVETIFELFYKKTGLSKKEIFQESIREVDDIQKKLTRMASQNSSKEKQMEAMDFYYGCVVRLLMAILKEADIYDSANAFRKEPLPRQDTATNERLFTDLEKRVEAMYTGFANSAKRGSLNDERTKLAQLCRDHALKNGSGIYRLELPTGAGKTMASTRYALASASQQKRDRFFYAAPYLSILDQSAKAIRQILGEDCEEFVLEHHSNVIQPEEHVDESSTDAQEYSVQKYLEDSWESPVVLTTTVQLFNTLFGRKSAELRRFSKLIQSVLVIDEVQSFPVQTIYSMNLMQNFLSNVMNCQIVHCTATQPAYNNEHLPHRLQYGPVFGKDNIDEKAIDIVPQDKINHDRFKRVEVFNESGPMCDEVWDTATFVSEVSMRLETEDSVLIVLHTKKAVKTLYEALKSELVGVDIIYLTTNLCAHHRLKMIEHMKNVLIQNRKGKAQNKLICISTKIVEAGVDLDMDVGFRSIAGIDSVLQSAGRVNREGKRAKRGALYIVNYEEDSLHAPALSDLKEQARAGADSLRSVPHEKKNPIPSDRMLKYYTEKYFVENRRKMSFDAKINGRKISLFELMSTNTGKRSLYSRQCSKIEMKIAQDFDTAARNSILIKDDQLTLIVEYENAELIRSLEEAVRGGDYRTIKSLLKQLQRFTIQIPKNQLEELRGHIRTLLDNEIIILEKKSYDEDIGFRLKLDDYMV